MMQIKDQDADTEWKWKNKGPGVDSPDRWGEQSACWRRTALCCRVFRASSIHFFTKHWVLHVPGTALKMKQWAKWAWCLFSRGQANISRTGKPTRKAQGRELWLKPSTLCLFSLFPCSQIAPQWGFHHPSMTHLGVFSVFFFFYSWIGFISFLSFSLSLFKAFFLVHVISRTESF